MNQKSKTRLFINEKISLNKVIYIKNKQYHFLKNVLRVKTGDEISIFDNQTGEWVSRIMSIYRDKILVQVYKKYKDLYPEPDIWLVFAIIKQPRLNITFQKATELGVSKFIPCITNYSSRNFINYRNLNFNIIEAAEQSERLTVPTLEKQTTLDQFIVNHPIDRGLIFCSEKHSHSESIFKSIDRVKSMYKKWTVLIGPEGGFSLEECNKISKLTNIITVSLGKRILRSDTATLAALFSLQSIID